LFPDITRETRNTSTNDLSVARIDKVMEQLWHREGNSIAS
jgi:hypothetical protein